MAALPKSTTNFQLTPKILMEYGFGLGDSSPVLVDPFRIISNAYDNSKHIVNGNNSFTKTKNTVDHSVVDLDSKFALLDNDSAHFYPVVDSNITVNNVTFTVNNGVKYDRVRIHLMSGYNFDDIKGFIISFYWKVKDSTVLKVANIAYTPDMVEMLQFSSKPIKLADIIYDKYIEFLIPSSAWAIQEQIDTGYDNTSFSNCITNSKFLDESGKIYCSFTQIQNLEMNPNNGVLYYGAGDSKRFVFNNTDQLALLNPVIKDIGGYFEYGAEYDSNSIEDFLYQLNGVPGNSYYLIHDLRFYEQIGIGFYPLENFTIVQKSDYNELRKIRPVLKNPDNIVSLVVDYTLILYNAIDGRNIFKTASYSTNGVQDFSLKRKFLNVGDTTQPIKVYNKIVKSDAQVIHDEVFQIKTKNIPVYINLNDIVIGGSNSELAISPFTNTIKFDFYQLNGDTKEPLKFYDLNNYYLVFDDDHNGKIYNPEHFEGNASKIDGELEFVITPELSAKILKLKNNSYHIIQKNTSGETAIFSGKWKPKS